MKKTILASCALLAMTAQATELNVVGSWSSLNLYKNFEAPFWQTTLNEVSNGAFTTQMTTFDQMGIGGGDVFRYLNDGMFDIGMTVADYTVSDAPELEGLDIPMIANDVAQAKLVAEAFLPIAELAANNRFNSHVLAIVPYPQQVLFCKSPLENLASIQGQKIRSSGRSTGEFINALGAESVNIAFNEVPGALERGVIDCAVTGSLSGYSAKWFEVSDYLLPLPIGGWDYVITMINLDKWNTLSTKEKTLLEDSVTTHFIAPVWENAISETEQGIACLTGQGECLSGKAANMTAIHVTEAEIMQAQKLIEKKVLPLWASRIDEKIISLWNEKVGKLVGLYIEKSSSK